MHGAVRYIERHPENDLRLGDLLVPFFIEVGLLISIKHLFLTEVVQVLRLLFSQQLLLPHFSFQLLHIGLRILLLPLEIGLDSLSLPLVAYLRHTFTVVFEILLVEHIEAKFLKSSTQILYCLLLVYKLHLKVIHSLIRSMSELVQFFSQLIVHPSQLFSLAFLTAVDPLKDICCPIYQFFMLHCYHLAINCFAMSHFFFGKHLRLRP